MPRRRAADGMFDASWLELLSCSSWVAQRWESWRSLGGYAEFCSVGFVHGPFCLYSDTRINLGKYFLSPQQKLIHLAVASNIQYKQDKGRTFTQDKAVGETAKVNTAEKIFLIKQLAHMICFLH